MRSFLARLAPVGFLFLFAPVGAEYLIGYDDTIGNPALLVFGLAIFGPIYGAPAILIREFTRRAGRGWPTMVLLGVAFGLVQAALLDQSLFNPAYRGIPYWNNLRGPTLISLFGTSGFMILGFIGGHVIGSICAPIALAESLVPRRATEPWLGKPGLAVTVGLWGIGAAFLLSDPEDGFRPSLAQLGVSAAVAVALVVMAFVRVGIGALGSKVSRPMASEPPPSPLAVWVISVIALGVRPLLDSLSARTELTSGWPATLTDLGVLVILAVFLVRWSRRPGWGGRHVLAVASGALTSIAVVAFTVDPLGHVPAAVKYATNGVLLALVLALTAVAVRRQRRVLIARSVSPAKEVTTSTDI